MIQATRNASTPVCHSVISSTTHPLVAGKLKARPNPTFNERNLCLRLRSTHGVLQARDESAAWRHELGASDVGAHMNFASEEHRATREYCLAYSGIMSINGYEPIGGHVHVHVESVEH